MYKVVLIDDESIIVEGLKSVIDWKKYDCEVVDTAFNATQGAKIIRKHSPHILITDIKMPDIDGLTMLAGLRSEYKDMQVTILTGYRNFEYGQKAVRLGVTRLLLKPCPMDELQEALSTMISKLKKDNDVNDEEDDVSDSEHSANSFIVRQAMTYLEENYANKITLQDVADHCYVSQWHLSKLLNKHTEKSFYNLLNAARINVAKQLLENPSLRICDISDMVGYADTGHFSRVFKKIVGASANTYRNKMNTK